MYNIFAVIHHLFTNHMDSLRCLKKNEFQGLGFIVVFTYFTNLSSGPDYTPLRAGSVFDTPGSEKNNMTLWIVSRQVNIYFIVTPLMVYEFFIPISSDRLMTLLSAVYFNSSPVF